MKTDDEGRKKLELQIGVSNFGSLRKANYHLTSAAAAVEIRNAVKFDKLQSYSN